MENSSADGALIIALASVARPRRAPRRERVFLGAIREVAYLFDGDHLTAIIRCSHAGRGPKRIRRAWLLRTR